MKRNLVLLLLVTLFCSATKENVDQTEEIAAHQITMQEHFEFVDREKALKLERLKLFIESEFENRIEELHTQLSTKLHNDEITLKEFQLKNCELKLIEQYVKEFRREVRKVNAKQKKVYYKPKGFKFNGRLVWKLLLEGITKIPKVGG